MVTRKTSVKSSASRSRNSRAAPRKPRPSATLPAYEQVKAHIRSHIASGDWRPDDPVPSEAALSETFGLSRMTVNRALRELAAEGWVARVKGSGTRVAALHRISSTLTLRDIHDEIAERGHRHTTDVLLARTEKAPSDIAQALGLRSGASVFHSVLVHRENGVAIQFEDRWVNPAAAPDYLATDFTQITPTHHLLEHAPITEAEYAIEAVLPSPDEARALGITRSEPCLMMWRRTVSGANAASVARLVYPGSRYRFAGAFQA